MGSLPATLDLSAYRGDSWSQELRLLRGPDPVDLTGAVVASAARFGNETPTALTVDVPTPANGVLVLRQPPAGLQAGTYTYDVQVTQAGTVTTWVRGKFTIAQDVTA